MSSSHSPDVERAISRFAAACRANPSEAIAPYLPEGPHRLAVLAGIAAVALELAWQARPVTGPQADRKTDRRWVEYYLELFPELHHAPALVEKMAAVEHRCRAAQQPSGEHHGGAKGDTSFGRIGNGPPEYVPSLDNRFSPAAEERMPSVPGYEILGILGRGGMGIVYKARHQQLDRVVALKMIRSGAGADELERERFHTEAQAAARLEHPNVVQIYEVGTAAAGPYLALELVDGGSLAKQLKAGPHQPRQAAQLTEVLARAVHAAHRQGIVHRDLKPGNILLTRDGTPKVADFGLAQRLDRPSEHTQTGAILGTPCYMAPEQAHGKSRSQPITPAADVYSLGAILYELLTGRPPFQGKSALDVLLQVRHDEPRPPRKINPRIPRDLETICLECLQKSPPRRYASALDLAADLARFLSGEPILARPVGRAERAWRWGRRHAVRLAVAAAVVAVLAVTGYAIQQGRRHGEAITAARERETDYAARLKEIEAVRIELQSRLDEQTRRGQELAAVSADYARKASPLVWRDPHIRQLADKLKALLAQFDIDFGDERLLGAEDARLRLARATAALADHRLREAAAELDGVVPRLRALLEEGPRPDAEADLELLLAQALNSRGVVIRLLKGRVADCLSDHNDAIRIYTRLGASEQRGDLAERLAGALNNRGLALLALQRYSGAVQDFSQAITIFTGICQRQPGPSVERRLALSLCWRGQAQLSLNRLPECLEDLTRAEKLLTRFQQQGREDAAIDLAGCLNDRAIAWDKQGRLDSALQDFSRVVALRRDQVKSEKGEEASARLATALLNRAIARDKDGKGPEALADVEEAVAIYSRLVEAGRSDLGRALNGARHFRAELKGRKPMASPP